MNDATTTSATSTSSDTTSVSRSNPARARWLSSGVVLIVLLILPNVLSSTWTTKVSGWFPMAIAALALALLTGFNGQISLGHGALYGVGAYAAGISINEWGFPYLGAMVFATVVTFCVGIVIGLPALRIKGMHLALVTVTVAVLFPQFLNQFDSITGGTTGLTVGSMQLNNRGVEVLRSIEFTAPEWTGLASDQWRYYWLLAFAVLAVFVARNVVNSRTGRAMVAIRDNETAAAVSGINVAATKVFTFGLSSALAGLAGSLFMLQLATNKANLASGSFGLQLSLYLLVAVVIGGSQSIAGPLIGTFIIVFFRDVIQPELPKRIHEIMPLLFGISLITTMFAGPGGIVGQFRHGVHKIHARRHKS